MAKKNFTIAKKPGAVVAEKSVAPAGDFSTLGAETMTRKTIEVPEKYFRMVKLRAVTRGIKEKELWSEIVKEYFNNNP